MTNFPTALDAMTNPSGTDALDAVAVPHAAQHANANDAIEALQAKVGVDGSAVAASLDYKVAALQSSVNLKAPLASPSFTGNVSSTGSILSVGGVLGYGAGAGGTVTQDTSKSTSVTLNKPCGQIAMHNASLAPAATVYFTFFNSLITSGSIIVANLTGNAGNYTVKVESGGSTGSCLIFLRNDYGAALADAVQINFAIIQGTPS